MFVVNIPNYVSKFKFWNIGGRDLQFKASWKRLELSLTVIQMSFAM